MFLILTLPGSPAHSTGQKPTPLYRHAQHGSLSWARLQRSESECDRSWFRTRSILSNPDAFAFILRHRRRLVLLLVHAGYFTSCTSADPSTSRVSVQPNSDQFLQVGSGSALRPGRMTAFTSPVCHTNRALLRTNPPPRPRPE